MTLFEKVKQAIAPGTGDHRNQLDGLDWFGDIHPKARGNGLDPVLASGVGGQGDGRYFATVGSTQRWNTFNQ